MKKVELILQCENNIIYLLPMMVFINVSKKNNNLSSPNIMLTFVAIVYVFMCWISNWNILWPVKMLLDGNLGDKAIAIVWSIMLFAGLH